MEPTPTIFPGDTATKKKRASHSELNERNFRRSMEFRLETDFYEQSEVMVAYQFIPLFLPIRIEYTTDSTINQLKLSEL
jgi:hypothetical protein